MIQICTLSFPGHSVFQAVATLDDLKSGEERTALPRGEAAPGCITSLRRPGRNLDKLLPTKPMPVDFMCRPIAQSNPHRS